jgi:predicted TIM-barrel fold metal-dependent hydrolase
MSEVSDRSELRFRPAARDNLAGRFSRSELPRRQLLGHAFRAAASAAALQMIGGGAFASPKPDGVRATTLTVDVHHHMLPDFFFRETNEASNPVGGIAPPAWSKELMLSFMDEAQIDVAVMSISTPGVHVGDDRRARSLARHCNEFAATLIQANPSRLGGFACLPLPDVDGALEELRYALDELKLDGVVVFSNARGIYLGDDRFAPLFEELERRRAVVFVHPTMSPDPTAHKLGLPDSLIDFVADTTRAVAQMHYGNRFARTPNVKYIIAHAGGTIPYLAGRFRIVDDMKVIPGGEARGTAADTFRRLYWDTALSWRDPVLDMLRATVGLDRVLFGSDFPYIRRDLAIAGVGELRRTAALDEAEYKAVLGGNALQLFPRLAARQR